MALLGVLAEPQDADVRFVAASQSQLSYEPDREDKALSYAPVAAHHCRQIQDQCGGQIPTQACRYQMCRSQRKSRYESLRTVRSTRKSDGASKELVQWATKTESAA